ncbi:hypothetical protein KA107_01020 [Candidatus Pacearchaeota archaeon]|nr:hypothetical protein [Candidatus Pacearchaeota archaeon]
MAEEKESSLILSLRDFKEEQDYHAEMYCEARKLGKPEEAQKALDDFYTCLYRQTEFYESAARIVEDNARKHPGDGDKMSLLMAKYIRSKKSELSELLNRLAIDLALAG